MMPSKRKTQEALAEMREAYSNYEPAYGETATDGADFLVNQITAALRDAVAGVDHLKTTKHILSEIVAAGSSIRSQAMATMFQDASAAVAAAMQSSSALLKREDLTALFGRKRFLVTTESSQHAYDIVSKSEKWLKGIVREIGSDLVLARQEAMRVSLVDSVQ